MRHAKAVPLEAELEDHERALAEKGRDDIAHVAAYLKAEGVLPDVVLCSSAARTRETLEIALAAWGSTPSVHVLDDLYLARWLTIVNLIRQVREPGQTLLVVGHNPGLEECARHLALPPGDYQTRKLHQILQGEYPTATACVFRFEIESWSAVERSEGEIEYLIRPRDIPAAK
nr:histidine phosphatase family protein [Rhizomicrobium palustre]